MPAVARLNDMSVGVCSCHKSPISTVGFVITTSPDVFANDLGIARIGDLILASCGHIGIIISGSSIVFSNSINVSRIGDSTVGCFVSTIVTGSPNTFSDGG
jgi:uncharacterized Zn-binding protein involved in type VI secretion